jgi:hypothetical protein
LVSTPLTGVTVPVIEHQTDSLRASLQIVLTRHSTQTSFVGKDGAMSIRYDENTKVRAVRLVREHRDDYDSEWRR